MTALVATSRTPATKACGPAGALAAIPAGIAASQAGLFESNTPKTGKIAETMEPDTGGFRIAFTDCFLSGRRDSHTLRDGQRLRPPCPGRWQWVSTSIRFSW
jgi:hypothetical protein